MYRNRKICEREGEVKKEVRGRKVDEDAIKERGVEETKQEHELTEREEKGEKGSERKK